MDIVTFNESAYFIITLIVSIYEMGRVKQLNTGWEIHSNGIYDAIFIVEKRANNMYTTHGE